MVVVASSWGVGAGGGEASSVVFSTLTLAQSLFGNVTVKLQVCAVIPGYDVADVTGSETVIVLPPQEIDLTLHVTSPVTVFRNAFCASQYAPHSIPESDAVNAETDSRSVPDKETC